MPVMNGVEATRRLRELPNFKRVPIIAISARVLQDDAARALAAGADGFLSKPLKLEELVAELGERLQLAWRYE